MNELKDKVALITGGTKGIGYGIAQSLLKAGLKVVITGRTDETVQTAAESLRKESGGQVLGIQSDVTNFESEEKAVAKILETFGSLDVVLANAGVGHFAPIDQMSAQQWNDTININLTGVFHTVKASVEALKKSKGYLITIASLAGTNFFPAGAAYNASKFGLVGFTQAVMMDLRQYDVKVTTIMPGSVTSHFNNHEPGDKDAWKIQPEDLGQMTVDLLKMHPRCLPSKIEVRPAVPPSK